jgi:hypothetical protein
VKDKLLAAKLEIPKAHDGRGCQKKCNASACLGVKTND